MANVAVYNFLNMVYCEVPGFSLTAPIRRSTIWAFIRKNFQFIIIMQITTLFQFSSENQLNSQGRYGKPRYPQYCSRPNVLGIHPLINQTTYCKPTDIIHSTVVGLMY